MQNPAVARAVERTARRAFASFGSDVLLLREDAGMTRAGLARACGLDAGYLDQIESGAAHPSIPTCIRLAIALGADLPLRLYPTTGLAIRDRHQSPIAEATLDSKAALFLATEIQSDLRRVEQLLRWSEAKAMALPSSPRRN